MDVVDVQAIDVHFEVVPHGVDGSLGPGPIIVLDPVGGQGLGQPLAVGSVFERVHQGLCAVGGLL